MSWGNRARAKARREASKLGHDLSRFDEGGLTYLAYCCTSGCTFMVEVDGNHRDSFRFLGGLNNDDLTCPATHKREVGDV